MYLLSEMKSVCVMCVYSSVSFSETQYLPPGSDLDINERLCNLKWTFYLVSLICLFWVEMGSQRFFHFLCSLPKIVLCFEFIWLYSLYNSSTLSLIGFKKEFWHQIKGLVLILGCLFVLNMKSKYYLSSPSVIPHNGCTVPFPEFHHQPVTCSLIPDREVWFVGAEMEVFWKLLSLTKKNVPARHSESRPLQEIKNGVKTDGEIWKEDMQEQILSKKEKFAWILPELLLIVSW